MHPHKFVAIISSLYYGERFSKLKSIGVVLSFIGVVIIVSKGSIEFFSSRTFFGDMLMIFDGFLWAIYTVLGVQDWWKFHQSLGAHHLKACTHSG